MPGMEILVSGAREIGISLNGEQMEKFLLYEKLIREWSGRMNLVRLKEGIDLYRYHFLDSLWCARGMEIRPGMRIIDIGSGAGFPGVPLKICFPGMKMILLESQGKRCSFLREVVRRLKLVECCVVQGRAEVLARENGYRDSFDAAAARALSGLPVLMELGIPFLKKGGRFIALKGRDVDEEIASSLYACKLMGGRLWKKITYRLHEDDERNLVVYEKVAETPEKYPRRNGIPQKRPLALVKE